MPSVTCRNGSPKQFARSSVGRARGRGRPGRDQRVDAQRRKQQRGRDAHRLERNLRRRRLADQHDGDVGEQHAERRAEHDGEEATRTARPARPSRPASCRRFRPGRTRRRSRRRRPSGTSGGGSSPASCVGLAAPRWRPRRTRSRQPNASASGDTCARTTLPSIPASAWLARVAVRMPAMIGSGFWKRAASMSASSCVLSPISPNATTPVETRKASMGTGRIAGCERNLSRRSIATQAGRAASARSSPDAAHPRPEPCQPYVCPHRSIVLRRWRSAFALARRARRR